MYGETFYGRHTALLCLVVSVAEQAGLSLTWSANPEDRFSRDETQFYSFLIRW